MVFSEALPWRSRTTWPSIKSMAGRTIIVSFFSATSAGKAPQKSVETASTKTTTSSYRCHKISQNRQPDVLAFLGVKLHAGDVAFRSRGRERFAVSRARGDD